MKFLLALSFLASSAFASAPPYNGISTPSGGKVTQYVSGNLCVAASSITAGTCNVNADGTDGVAATYIDGFIMDVKSFGAKCDGVTDDSPAFAVAIASANAHNGGTIIIPDGTKTCVLKGNPGISIQHPHIHLKGIGWGWSQSRNPQLTYLGVSTAVVIGGTGDATDTQIEDLDIAGSTAAKGSGMVFTSSMSGLGNATALCYQCSVNRVTVHGFFSTGTAAVYLQGGIFNSFNHVAVYDAYYGFYVSGNITTTSHFSNISARSNTSYGFYDFKNSGIIIDGYNLFESNGDSGIALMGDESVSTYSIYISGADLENNVRNWTAANNITTGTYQVQFLTNPLAPNLDIIRDVHLDRLAFSGNNALGDIDIACANNITVSHIQGGAGASSSTVRVERTATNVQLYDISTPGGGNVDPLRQAAFTLSSGTVALWGNLTTSGTVTTGGNITANSVSSQAITIQAITNGGDQKRATVLLQGTANAVWSMNTNDSTLTGVSQGDFCLNKETSNNGASGCKVVVHSNGFVGLAGQLNPQYATDILGGIRASSGIYTTTGVFTGGDNTHYTITSSSGIQIQAGGLVFPDGSMQVTASTGGGGGGSAYTADETSLHLAGTVFSAKSGSTTLQGNTFNGASQLVKLDSVGNLAVGTAPGDSVLTVSGTQSAASSLHQKPGIMSLWSSNGVDLVFTSSNTSPYSWSLQAKDHTSNGIFFPITLNPLGGTVGIGTLTPCSTCSFEVAGAASIDGTLNMGANRITTVADPVSAQDVATKNYVDTSTGSKVLPTKVPARLGTAAALPTNVYANGSSGVGATLTGSGLGAITIDGVTPVAGDRILVNNEATSANNGIYVVTVNAGGAFFILTRTTDFDSSFEMGAGEALFVTSGTTNADTFFALIASVTTVGTSPVNFSQINATFNGGTVANTVVFKATVTFQQDVQAAGSTVTFNATQTINWQTQGPWVTIVLTANTTSSTWSNMALRGRYILELVQGGSGGYTYTWPSAHWPGLGSAPALSTAVGARDYFVILFGADGIPHIQSSLNN